MNSKAFVPLAFTAMLIAGCCLQGAIDDAYTPLKLYNGKWEVTTVGDKDKTHLENHCAQTGLFYVCEQNVDGKTMGMVVFQPVAKLPGGGQSYKSTGLSPDAGAAPGWNPLTIVGDRWTYSWDDMDNGKKVLWRNVNQFTGSDKIHFEIQQSDDGRAWKTMKSGDEVRLH